MNINIPDKLYKFLILVGVLLIGYSFYKKENSENYYFSKIDDYRSLEDSIKISQLKIDHQQERLVDISQTLSKTYEVKNPLIENDSLITFTRILTGPENDIKVSDSIQKLWLNYKNSKFDLTILKEKLSFADKYLDEEKKLKNDYINAYYKLLILGYLLLFTGVIIWMNDSDDDSKRNLKQYEKVYPFCQSCGKDFSSMRSYGTNKDKSFNYVFCKECYKKGNFREPDLTKSEAKNRFFESVKNRNWLVRLIAKIRWQRLERWL